MEQKDETQELESTQAEETQEELQDNEAENASPESESVQEEESTQEEEVDWKARALKAEKAIEKAKKKGKTTDTEGVSPEKLARLELKAEGVKEADDQDYVLKVAQIEGVEVDEALKLDFVQDRLKANERKRMSAEATPKGNNRTNTQVDEVQSWVKKYKQNGSLPDNNPALTAKILRALKNGA